MEYGIISYELADGRTVPALVLDERDQEQEDGSSVRVRDLRVFATAAGANDEFVNGVPVPEAELDATAPAGEPAAPTEPATPATDQLNQPPAS